VQIAVAIKYSLHRRMIGLPSMVEQWQQFAVVVSQNVLRSSGVRVEHFYDTCVIVIALQYLKEIPFCVGAVVGGPIGPGPEVSKQMECRGA